MIGEYRIVKPPAPPSLFYEPETRQEHVADPPSLTLDLCLAEKLSHTTPTKPP